MRASAVIALLAVLSLLAMRADLLGGVLCLALVVTGAMWWGTFKP